jgi:hypothetical protein
LNHFLDGLADYKDALISKPVTAARFDRIDKRKSFQFGHFGCFSQPFSQIQVMAVMIPPAFTELVLSLSPPVLKIHW